MLKLYFGECTKDTEHIVARDLAERGFCEIYRRDAVLGHNSRGKPYFIGEDKVYVSISHSNERCIAVISDSEVGADIEYMNGGTDRLVRIADRYFCTDETAYVRFDPEYRFYEIWCKKESYLKMTGEGFSRNLNSFSVFKTDEAKFTFEVRDGYGIAVCTRV